MVPTLVLVYLFIINSLVTGEKREAMLMRNVQKQSKYVPYLKVWLLLSNLSDYYSPIQTIAKTNDVIGMH